MQSFHWKWGLVGAILLVGLGCSHAISPAVRQGVDADVTFGRVLQSPGDHAGKRIIWGGEIVATQNQSDQVEIEVIQKTLDSAGEPLQVDDSGGRFIFIQPGYLEPEIYSKGRRVTGAGKIVGSRMGQVGEREYLYPLVELEELHLWSEAPEYDYNPYYPSFYYGPWWYPYPYSYGLGYGRDYFRHRHYGHRH